MNKEKCREKCEKFFATFKQKVARIEDQKNSKIKILG